MINTMKQKESGCGFCEKVDSKDVDSILMILLSKGPPAYRKYLPGQIVHL